MRSSTGCCSTFLRNVAFCNNTSSEAKVGIVGKIRKVEIYINKGRLSNAQGCACREYWDEFSARYNTRDIKDNERFEKAINNSEDA
ncbi:MAG TPA: hypothetical protein VNT20_02485 [Flavisolibacter sp.]|jgi:hypothetical protein|nr:hypothetical protein [Flavisolibacter sp.]